LSRIDLKLVDENFTASDPADKSKAAIAAAIREGRRREREAQAAERARLEGEHAGKLEGQAQAHEGELRRHGKLIAKAAWRDGGLMGTVFGMGLAAAIITGTYWITKDMLFARLAADRTTTFLEAGPTPQLYDPASPTTDEPRSRSAGE